MSGSTVIMEAWRDDVAAILLLGYPGQEGGHVSADVLLGHVNPSGKLPYVVPRSLTICRSSTRTPRRSRTTCGAGYRKLERDGTQPAFPFGFGLSYTTFELANFRLAQATIGADGALVATLDVTNTGDRAGAEAVQVYVGARSSKVERAPKELKAFNKIELEPGETRTGHLAVPAADLAYYDKADGWTVEPGEYEVIVGRHSLDDQALSTSLAIQ